MRRPMLVIFHAPWCGHCRSTLPEIEKITKIQTGAYNCQKNRMVCAFMGISGYPTIKYFSSFLSSVRYPTSKDRTASTIEAWVQKLQQPVLQQLGTVTPDVTFTIREQSKEKLEQALHSQRGSSLRAAYRIGEPEAMECARGARPFDLKRAAMFAAACRFFVFKPVNFTEFREAVDAKLNVVVIVTDNEEVRQQAMRLAESDLTTVYRYQENEGQLNFTESVVAIDSIDQQKIHSVKINGILAVIINEALSHLQKEKVKSVLKNVGIVVSISFGIPAIFVLIIRLFMKNETIDTANDDAADDNAQGEVENKVEPQEEAQNEQDNPPGLDDKKND